MATNRTAFLHVALLLVAAALLGTAANAQTTTWEFTPIADSSAELASFSVPSINNTGQIAFVATFDDEVALGQAVYRRDANGVLTVIADTSGPIAAFNGDPAMNAGGLVTFTATMDDGSVSVLCGNGGALVTIANTVTNALRSIDSEPFISDTGGVVILRAVRSVDSARVILTGTGGIPDTLLASTGPYDPVNVAGINATDVVAFEALDGAGARGVYLTTDGVAVTPIAVTSAGGFTAVEALDINNNGTVVFFTETTTGVGSLSVQTADSPPRAFAESPSPFISFGPAAVAESGAVAFRGTLELGLNGIFAGGTGLYEKAIALGDPLLGSGVTALDTGPQAVTNSGRFVFRASRVNSTTGIYLATPSAADGGGGGGGAIDLVSVTLLLLANRLRGRLRRRLRRGPAPRGRFGA